MANKVYQVNQDSEISEKFNQIHEMSSVLRISDNLLPWRLRTINIINQPNEVRHFGQSPAPVIDQPHQKCWRRHHPQFDRAASCQWQPTELTAPHWAPRATSYFPQSANAYIDIPTRPTATLIPEEREDKTDRSVFHPLISLLSTSLRLLLVSILSTFEKSAPEEVGLASTEVVWKDPQLKKHSGGPVNSAYMERSSKPTFEKETSEANF
ncbi:hypothetical protein Aperf_G00000042390 [Anoplocephala perfoliata]